MQSRRERERERERSEKLKKVRRRRKGGEKGGREGGKKKKSRDQLCVNMELKRETFRPRLYDRNMQNAKKNRESVCCVILFLGTAAPLFLSFFVVLDGRSVLPTFQSLVHRPFIPPCQKNIRICPFELFRGLRSKKTQNATHTQAHEFALFGRGPKKRFRSKQQHVWPGSKRPSQKKARLNRSSTQVFFLISPSVVSHGFDGNGQAGRGGGTFAGRKRVFSSEVSLINILKNCRNRENGALYADRRKVNRKVPAVCALDRPRRLVTYLLQCSHILPQKSYKKPLPIQKVLGILLLVP